MFVSSSFRSFVRAVPIALPSFVADFPSSEKAGNMDVSEEPIGGESVWPLCCPHNFCMELRPSACFSSSVGFFFASVREHSYERSF
jgi:hypothetical protein